MVFVAVILAATLALVWPIYGLFSGIRPLVLGLPMSMAWVAFWVVAVFGAMIWLYRSDSADKQVE